MRFVTISVSVFVSVRSTDFGFRDWEFLMWRM